jgi:hypothetical protein
MHRIVKNNSQHIRVCARHGLTGYLIATEMVSTDLFWQRLAFVVAGAKAAFPNPGIVELRGRRIRNRSSVVGIEDGEGL